LHTIHPAALAGQMKTLRVLFILCCWPGGVGQDREPDDLTIVS
jgi:hypothetical protein